MGNKHRCESSWLHASLALGLLLGGSLGFPANAAPRESVASVTSRPGVTQSYFLIKPETAARAIAVLFVGGDGELGLKASGPTRGTGNFLMRVRRSLADAGLVLAFPDTPSDQSGDPGRFRTTPQHAEDIAAVVKAVAAAHPKLPVFLIGTSRGTISAANGAARLPPGAITGLVLTSTVTVQGKRGQESVYDVPIQDIRLPVMALAHRDDGCYVTPPATVAALLDAMPEAPRKDAFSLSGGDSGKGDACGAKSHHGFLSIDDRAVTTMVGWIDSVLAGR